MTHQSTNKLATQLAESMQAEAQDSIDGGEGTLEAAVKGAQNGGVPEVVVGAAGRSPMSLQLV